MTRVVLDISRLVSRIRHARPSGVDRVEMAYARGLLNGFGEGLSFATVHPTGRYGRLRHSIARSYLDELEARWTDREGPSGQRSVPSVIPWMTKLFPENRSVGDSDVVVQVSPHHLDRTAKKRAILAREDARFVCMVHDLIPIEYPEYARPNGRRLHEARMSSVAELADAVIVNSAATGQSLARWIESRGGNAPRAQVALLGTHILPEAAPHTDTDGKPYFVCLGTIEPRKNHLLLLHLWRKMAELLSPVEVPKLLVVGRRGWENEQIIDLLDRCSTLSPFVEEISSCGDEELAAIVRGARALLMPSFAEGYGMPIAEALAVGTPVIASDLPAHREAGGSAPDYLDPLDGPSWQSAILDFADKGSLWQAQKDRLSSWSAPTWSDHIEIVTKVIEETARRSD